MANDFKTFAASGGANVYTQVEYVALTSVLANGVTAGIADSKQFNKTLRQSSLISKVVTDFISQKLNVDCIDDGTTATLLNNFNAAILTSQYIDLGGTTTSYTGTVTPAFGVLKEGMLFVVDTTPVGTNTTTTPTLNINGLGAVGLIQQSNVALPVGSLPQYALVIYTSSYSGKFIVLNPDIQGRLLNVQYITSTATYTPTVGTKFVDVEIVGGGASGGGAANTTAGYSSAGGGGGSGAYARKRITSAFSGVTVTIGTGGAVGATGAVGNAGGTSSFGAIISCTGGVGGAVGTAYNTAAVSSLAAAGGSASGGDININGGSGLAGLIFSAGTVSNLSGIGGANPLGFGGGQVGGTTAGGIGLGYGSGGSGGSNVGAGGGQVGGAGKAGICIIREYGV